MTLVVDRIERTAEFERLRAAYESVYARDPNRTVFVSWPWLRSYIAAMEARWTLLAARRGSEYLGFLLVVEQGVNAGAISFYREIGLGAYPTADYAGLVMAGEEDAVAQAFARAIEALPWDVLRARSVRDPRLRSIVARVGEGKLVEREAPTPCHVVALPPTWDEYVERNRNGKNGIRYALRRRNLWSDARFTDADDATVERDIEALLTLNHHRWKTNLRKARRTYGNLFREAYARGCCRIGVLWDANERPLAAQAAFVDPDRRSWGIYMLAYDQSAAKHSPGIGMLMRGLERAISERFTEYDFLRGGESYKTRFGSELRWLDNVTVRRRSPRVRAAEYLWNTGLRAKSALRTAIVGKVAASV